MASASTAAAPASTQPAPDPAKLIAAARVRRAAHWFYWIAGLSLVNSAIGAFGGSVHFVVGLGLSGLVDAVAKPLGSAGVLLDLIINGIIAGVFCLFGYLAGERRKWAFLVGMLLYGLDGLLLLVAGDFFSVAFHGYALFAMSRGLSAVD